MISLAVLVFTEADIPNEFIETTVDSDKLRQIASTIIMTHHEKWNGTGYPNGLKGDEIPISGQICALADVYDALRSKRPYKEAFSVEKTLEIMRSNCGTHFSPYVFNAFETVVEEFENIRSRFEV